ncbi:MAG TPA: DUF4382 domain-containing protein [Phycisphaerae bacterium]|nr:DUF4382 domain-containing protein [Phycisphaerae bacterium]
MDCRPGAFLTIFEGEKEFDLLDLQNGRADLLADVEVPVGTYTQMRLVVTQGTVELKDGRPPFVLTVPSGEQSGIKLQFTFTIEEGAETTLLLDVDLSRAFRPVPAGRIEDPDTIRQFKFQPAFAMRLVNLLEAGSVSGAVTDEAGAPLADASVTAFDADEEVTSTSTEDDGTYVLAGLPAGEYRLEFSAASYQDAEVEGVEVTVGEETPSGEVALAAE